MHVSPRLASLKASPTLAINAMAQRLKAQGRDLINLSVGEPDFNTPEPVKEAAHEAIRNNKTRYTPADGIPSLKQAIIEKYQRDNGLNFDPSNILVSCGGKHSLYNLFQALIHPGDEVLVPAPYWVSYPELVALAEGSPQIVDCGPEMGYRLTEDVLRQHITPRTRGLILCSPSNPTGMVYSHAALLEIAQVLREHPEVWVVSDDIYEHQIWASEPFANLAMLAPDLRPRIFLTHSVSKSYAMTGWRVGYMAGDAQIVSAAASLQSQSTSNPCSIAQAAAEAALRLDVEVTHPMRDAFHRRATMMYEALNRIPGIRLQMPEGAFYVFPDMRTLMRAKGFASDLELCEHLLNHGVVAVPGSASGAPGHLRFSTALSDEMLEAALGRIQSAF